LRGEASDGLERIEAEKQKKEVIRDLHRQDHAKGKEAIF